MTDMEIRLAIVLEWARLDREEGDTWCFDRVVDAVMDFAGRLPAPSDDALLVDEDRIVVVLSRDADVIAALLKVAEITC